VENDEQVVDALLTKVTDRTRLVVISHITSPTAVTLPVGKICKACRDRDVAVCIDGPHAVAQLPLDLQSLDCDYYTASCHKWLCAPFGSGFLYVHPRHQDSIRPPTLSWGRLPPNRPEKWSDEYVWSGTRDPSAFLTIPAAIEFLESVPIEAFRARTHDLARYARERLVALTGSSPLKPDSNHWYGSMAHVPLPPGKALPLQRALWERHHIEVPIIDWKGQRYVRVSCHLYTCPEHIDLLVDALDELCYHESL
jgi:isopenicillin-N epimerase